MISAMDQLLVVGRKGIAKDLLASLQGLGVVQIVPAHGETLGPFSLSDADRQTIVGTAVAAAVIWATGWMRADAVATLVVVALMFHAGAGLVAQAGRVLLEGAPDGTDVEAIRAHMLEVDHVRDVHDLHVWDMSPGEPALIGHVEITDLTRWPEILQRIKAMLLEKHGIDHTTLQAEVAPQEKA